MTYRVTKTYNIHLKDDEELIELAKDYLRGQGDDELADEIEYVADAGAALAAACEIGDLTSVVFEVGVLTENIGENVDLF